jgi:CheY-like chemotaxis protein
MGRLTTPEAIGGGRLPAGPGTGPKTGLRVLILEPSRRTALLLQETLEQLGIDVCGIAADEAQALTLARDTQPDLTLIESGFAGHWEDGVEIARRLHACQGIRSVFLAPSADPQALTRITASYPLGVVHPPYSAAQLKTALDLAAGRLRSSHKGALPHMR